MSPLLVIDDICIVGAGQAVSPWCSSKNENSRASKKIQDNITKKKTKKKGKEKIKTCKGLYLLLPL